MSQHAKPRRSSRADAWRYEEVRIVGERVQALLKEFPEWTATALAKELQRQGIPGASRQTIGQIGGGKNKTCRAPVRRALAEIFAVSEEWLAGEVDYCPSYEYLLHVRPRGPSHGVPPAADRAMQRVAERIAHAWARDLDRGIAPLPPMFSSRLPPTAMRVHAIALSILHVFSAWRWRMTVFNQEDVEPIDPVVADRMAMATADFIEALLEPWLDDTARLEYSAIMDLLTRLLVVPPREAGPATDVVREHLQDFASGKDIGEDEIDTVVDQLTGYAALMNTTAGIVARRHAPLPSEAELEAEDLALMRLRDAHLKREEQEAQKKKAANRSARKRSKKEPPGR